MIATGLAQLPHEQVGRFRPKELLACAGVKLVNRAGLRLPPFPIAEAPTVARLLAASPRLSDAIKRAPWQTIESPIELDQTAKPRDRYPHL